MNSVPLISVGALFYDLERPILGSLPSYIQGIAKTTLMLGRPNKDGMMLSCRDSYFVCRPKKAREL